MSEETQVDTQAETQVASEDWRESIPEDLRNDPSLADVQDVASLAKGYVHAQHMIGSDKVAIPAKDAAPEVLDEFYNKLGRPETAQGYEMPTENMPDVPIKEELTGAFFEEAHRIGLNSQQAAALVRWQAEQAQQGQETWQQDADLALDKATDTMRREYGKAYDEKLDMAKNAAQQYGGDELMALLDRTGLGNEPALIKAFANVGKAVSNDEIIGGGGRQGFMMSPAEAQQQIASIKRDPNFMKSYTDTSDSGHQGAVTEMGRLYNLAYPTTDE